MVKLLQNTQDKQHIRGLSTGPKEYRWSELSDSLRRALLIFFDSFFVAIFLFTLRAVLEDTEDVVYIHSYLLFCTIVLCRNHNQIQILQIRFVMDCLLPQVLFWRAHFLPFGSAAWSCYLRENQTKKRATSPEFNPLVRLLIGGIIRGEETLNIMSGGFH